MKQEVKIMFWKELYDSIKYCIESKKGKFSLNTYLDITSEYTDKLIKDSENENLQFLGGECKVQNDIENNNYDFEIIMYFEDVCGGMILKEAKRSLSKSRFTSEMETIIGSEKKFEIKKPL